MTAPKKKIDLDLLNGFLGDALKHVEALPNYPAKEKVDPYKNTAVGTHVEDEGVYLGIWAPKDRGGVSLGKVFNVFAAPEDLINRYGNKTLYTYVNTFERIGELKNWFGYPGEAYGSDVALYTALKNGSYAGGWVIPPLELILGTDTEGHEVQADCFSKHKSMGSFKDTFGKVSVENKGYHEWYWSCTRSPAHPAFAWGGALGEDGHSMDEFLINNGIASCRPVRLVERVP